jgi:hypothetical protein
MVEQYVLPMVGNYVELKVLSYKLKASFYHIFVLFHNEPAVNDRINRSRSGGAVGGGGAHSRNDSYGSLFPDPLSPRLSKQGSRSPTSGRQRSPAISLGGPVSATTRTPPGLPLPKGYADYYANGSNGNGGNGTATFLLPLQDYTPLATAAFREANELAERLLPGSHPVRLSVKVEYVAYIYDCLHEAEQSRKLAKISIRHVYEAQEGMDDESFEDAAEMVGILGRMMKRGLGSSGGGSSGSQPRMTAEQTSSRDGRDRDRERVRDRGGGNGGGNGRERDSRDRDRTRDRGGGGNGGNGRGHRRRESGVARTGSRRESSQPTTWV